MNYFELISDRDRSLTVMFDYCSEGIWGRNAGYRFSRLPNILQKEYCIKRAKRCELNMKRDFDL